MAGAAVRAYSTALRLAPDVALAWRLSVFNTKKDPEKDPAYSNPLRRLIMELSPSLRPCFTAGSLANPQDSVE